MRRPPASIVILTWNAWDRTRACLEALRPTLGLRDQVIVVDNGSTDRTPVELGHRSWLQVLTNPQNRGIPAARNQGAGLAIHDIVVFLDNDTVPVGRWLDALLEPLVDPTVVATGPVSNAVGGWQSAVGPSYTTGDIATMRRVARSWATEHRGETVDVGRLDGFCLAVRRGAFERIGGFDEAYGQGGFEDDDLSSRLAGEGRLMVAQGSFVHHAAHQTFLEHGLDWYGLRERNRGRYEARFGPADEPPLVSACLITKDEEENLPSCLSSLHELADEVVIYDTGSSDGTVDLARRSGATVIEGYWDDDFSRARNVALAHCSGRWIAWLDADETVVCDDIPRIREILARTPVDIDGFSVAIDNLTGSGVGSTFVHSATRLFQRARCEWAGRLHEQISGRGDHHGILGAAIEGIRLRHTGYLDTAMAARNKIERNIRVAATEVEQADGWDRGFSLVSLGRSYMTAGRWAEAVTQCAEGVRVTKNPVTRRLGLRTQVESLLVMGRLDEADERLSELSAHSQRQILVDILRSRLLHARGRADEALAAYDAIEWMTRDDDGFEYDPAMFARHRADMLVTLGRYDEAADTLLAVLANKGLLDLHLGTVVEYLERSGRDFGALARALPVTDQPKFLAQILQLRPDMADQVLEACWDVLPPVPVLATARALAPRLRIDRLLAWDARLRQVGLADECLLLARAADSGRRPSERVLAAAVSVAAFGDERGRDGLAAAARDIRGPAHRQRVRHELGLVAPDLVPLFDAAKPPPSPVERPDAAAPRATIVVAAPTDEGLAEQLDRLAEVTDLSGVTLCIATLPNLEPACRQVADAVVPSAVVVGGPPGASVVGLLDTGAAAADGAVVTFLTPGTAPRPGWLEELLAAVDGAVPAGPAVVTADGIVVQAGLSVVADRRELPHRLRVIASGHGTKADRTAKRPVAVTAVGLPGLTLPRTLLARAGGLDSRYSGELAAADLCLTLAELGHQATVVPGAVITADPARQGFGTDEQTRQHDSFRFNDRWRLRVTPDEVVDVEGAVPDDGDGDTASALVVAADSATATEAASAWRAHGYAVAREIIAAPVDAGAGAPEMQRRLALRTADRHYDAVVVDTRLATPHAMAFLAERCPTSLVTTTDAPAGPGTEADALPAPPSPPPARPLVRWTGDVHRHHSLANVNRALIGRLAARGTVEVTVAPLDAEVAPAGTSATSVVGADGPAVSGPASVEVRHHWPPNLRPPEDGAWVMIQPWEMGGLPATWVGPIRDAVDELWVPSRWVRDCALASGIPSEVVQVVPNGVDVDRFRPDGPRYPLRTTRATRLLFVGGLITRKGFDILLSTYRATFCADDDVCLVVKPFGAQDVYRGMSMVEDLRAAAAGGGPEIEIIDADLAEDDMAALYRSCHALALPYRGEGFGLPLLEAMASGLPVIATAYGASRDFCDDEVGWTLDADIVPVPGMDDAGFLAPCSAGSWWAEPDPARLTQALAAVVASPDEAAARGAAGRQRAIDRWTWDHAASIAEARLLALAESAPRRTHLRRAAAAIPA